MNRVLELRKAITTALLTAHPRVYYEQAPEGAAYPYLTYLMPDSLDDGTLEQFVLEVDGWDAPADGSTVVLEQMMHAADRAIQRLVVVVNGVLTMRFLHDRRLVLDDDDPAIRRRQYVYQARTYERRD